MPARATIVAGSIKAGGEDAFFGQARERLEVGFPGPLHALSGSAIKTDARATTLGAPTPSGGWFFHFITEARSLGAGAQG